MNHTNPLLVTPKPLHESIRPQDLACPATVYASGAKIYGSVLGLDIFEGVQEVRAELTAIASFPGALDQVIVANPGGSHARKLPARNHLRIHGDLGEHLEQRDVVVLLKEIVEDLAGNPVPLFTVE